MITVLETGLQASVQDLGRCGHAHLGVPVAGAADAFSLRLANRLAGNPEGAAALELAGGGARLRFDAAARIALAGGTAEVTLDGQPVAMHQTLAVPPGAVLELGHMQSGWRCYLAVAGGITVTPVLGSASTDTLAGLGPAPLERGMQLVSGPAPEPSGSYLRAPAVYPQQARLRVLAGPHEDWFTGAARQAFVSGEYAVSSRSDRTGLRLEGAALERAKPGELASMGMVTGAVQVPGGGQPIVLLANHGATGGYPVLAVVIAADLGALGQLAPGGRVRFVPVSRAEAIGALHAQEQRLQQDIISADDGLLAARALMLLAGGHQSLRKASLKDGRRHIRISKDH